MTDTKFPSLPRIKPDAKMVPEPDEVFIHDLGKGQEIWLRTGGCSPGCGACCTAIITALPSGTTEVAGFADWVRWLTLHDIKIVEPGDGRAYIHVPKRCKALEACGKCTLHGLTNMPEMCKNYPTHPDDIRGLEKVCTYHFIKVEHPST